MAKTTVTLTAEQTATWYEGGPSGVALRKSLISDARESARSAGEERVILDVYGSDRVMLDHLDLEV